MEEAEQKQPGNFTLDFNAAAKRAREEFGDALSRTIFLDDSGAEPAYPATIDDKVAQSYIETVRKLAKKRNNNAAFTYSLGDDGPSVLYYRHSTHQTEKEARHTFNHELGHILVPGGSRSTNGADALMAEAAGEAFAVLRQIQAYGNTASQLSGASQRVAILYLNGWELVAPVIDAIVTDAVKTDFTNLSPLETVAKAQSYLDKLPTPGEKKALDDLFAGIREPFKETGDLPVGELADITFRQPPGSMAYKIGYSALTFAVGESHYYFDTEAGKELLQKLTQGPQPPAAVTQIKAQPIVL